MIEQFLLNPYIILAIVLWTMPWKGVALWRAARLHHTGWFIALLVINSLAVLDIIYIFVVARKSTLEIAKSEKN